MAQEKPQHKPDPLGSQHVPKSGVQFFIKVDEDTVTFDHQKVTGKEILAAVGKANYVDFDLYQNLTGGGRHLVAVEDQVDLLTDGIENFQSNPKVKQYTIIVNSREKIVTDHKLTYLQVVQLYLNGAPLDTNAIYTITYRKGNNDNHEGSMVEGDVVIIKDGMVFNVTATTKS